MDNRFLDPRRWSLDLRAILGLSLFLLACRALFWPGLDASLAWRSWDNPIYMAERFAHPDWFANDRVASYLSDVYPLLSLMFLIPAVLARYAAVPPVYPVFAMVAVNDLLVALAVYWLCRALRLAPSVSLVGALLSISTRMLDWNLAGYHYLGHDFPYPGSFVLPFVVAILPALMQGRVRTALTLVTVALLIHPGVGALGLSLILCFSLRIRRLTRWYLLPAAALAWVISVQALVGAQFSGRVSHAMDAGVVMAIGHFVPPFTRGELVSSPVLGCVLIGCLAALSLRRPIPTTATQRFPLLCLAGLVALGAVAWVIALKLEFLSVLRVSPLRNSVLLNLALMPFLVPRLLAWMGGPSRCARLAAGLLLILLVLDHKSAGTVVMLLPCLLALAWHEVGRPGADTPLAALLTVYSLVVLDLLLQAGVLAGVTPPALRERVALVQPWEQALAVGMICGLVVASLRRVKVERFLPATVAGFMLVTLAGRSLATAQWMLGEPQLLKQAGLWAREHTPTDSKFIFFELTPEGHQLSFAGVAGRAGAELWYTAFKCYSPDRRLVEIDAFVHRLYDRPEPLLPGADPAPAECYRRYRSFDQDDFLRVGRLSASNFLVLSRPQAVDFPAAWQNSRFGIFRMPAQFESTIVTLAQVEAGKLHFRWDCAAPGRLLEVQLFDGRTTRRLEPRPISGRGEGAWRLPADLPPGRVLPLVGVLDRETGRRIALQGDIRGDDLAFWEYLP